MPIEPSKLSKRAQFKSRGPMNSKTRMRKTRNFGIGNLGPIRVKFSSPQETFELGFGVF